jgi:hypothetical protein
MNIIIPTLKDRDGVILPDLLRSIKENSIFDHTITLLESDTINPNKRDIFDRIEWAVRDSEDNHCMITNSDMIYGYEWDKALEDCYWNNHADLVSMANICDLRRCGFGSSLNLTLDEFGSQRFEWCDAYPSPKLYKTFNETAKELRIKYAGKTLKGYNFVPFMMSKNIWHLILGNLHYYEGGDLMFFQRCKDLNLKTLIAVDSIAYHYVAFSMRQP